jgi:hypothetical protein
MFMDAKTPGDFPVFGTGIGLGTLEEQVDSLGCGINAEAKANADSLRE